MQLFIIALIIPWLILLSKTPLYRWFRVTTAAMAGIAAMGWIVQRTTGSANLVTSFVETGKRYGVWGIVVLAAVTLVVYATTVFGKRSVRVSG